MENTKRIIGYSYLRVLASLAIVVLHVSYMASQLFSQQITEQQMQYSLIIVRLMMWAVPCFVMVTGALLLSKEDLPWSKLFGRYIRRVILALLICGFLFRIIDAVLDHEAFSTAILTDALREIFTGTSWSHLWYLYLLLGLYLLMPFYRMIACNSTKKELLYYIGVCLFFLSLLPLTKIFGYTSGFYIHVATIYPMYLFAGYLLGQKRIIIPKPGAVVLILVGTFGIIVANMISYAHPSLTLDHFWNYPSIFVAMQATGIFSLMRTMQKTKGMILQRALQSADKCSFGIYLLHLIFARYLLRYKHINPYQIGNGLGFVPVILGIYVASWLLTFTLQRIPGCKSVF